MPLEKEKKAVLLNTLNMSFITSKAMKVLAIGAITIIGLRIIYIALAPASTKHESFEVSLETLESSTVDIDIKNRGEGVWYNFTVQRGQTMPVILQQAKITGNDIAALSNFPLVEKTTRKLKRRATIRVLRSFDGSLLRMQYLLDNEKMLEVSRETDLLPFVATIETIPIDIREQFATIVIRESLFNDSARVQVPIDVARQLYSIFAWDIDFSNQLRRGDRFSFVYEKIYREGVHLSHGKIIAAEYKPANSTWKKLRAVYFKPAGSRKGAYYDSKGKSIKKAFLREPVDPSVSRISSRYSKSRFHPILKKFRGHYGIDFAAPRGTPVYSTGDGKIEYYGYKGAYGNLVKVKHSSTYTTYYGHLQRFARGMRVGKKVRQKEVIGYVGSTGQSTGPHVHYEFRVDGKHVNPRAIKIEGGINILRKYRDVFNTHAQEQFSLLNLNIENAKANGAVIGPLRYHGF